MRMENNLGRDNIKKLVWRIAIPSMLAQFVSVLYSIVDRMYIGNIAEIGDLALAGVGVCGPVVTMVGSVAFLVGVGGSPLMSRRMGEGRMEEAKKNSGQLLYDAGGLGSVADGGAYLNKAADAVSFWCQRDNLSLCGCLFYYIFVRNRICPAGNRNEPVYYLSGVCQGWNEVSDYWCCA